MPTKAEKQEKELFLSGLVTKIFCAMLDDIVMDSAIQAHNEVSRSRAVCVVCGTRCNAVHVPGSSKLATSSRAATPMAEGNSLNGATTSIPGSTPSSVKDGNVYLDCVNCYHPIASNRYAAHLSSCLGLSSARRTANRGSIKSKQSDAGRSNSPASEIGNISEDDESKPSAKGKMKSKGKRADEAEFSMKRKRPISPQVSPNKKPKPKGLSPLKKAGSSGVVLSSLGSQSKVPSKLRDSSTAPYPGSTSSSSRSSSPDGTSSAPLAAKFNSPNFKTKGSQNGSKSPMTVKRPSPPRPPPPVPAYMHEDAGEETGSSTDTDSN
ncbi:hypothetical protein E1B28_001321 [Marasmius oreades]|uniref:SAGA-associated factor 11 n=1 Tax=Marasmius oreades TaxID=181124 RepID=A0A9P7V3G9_9AGAR|nr:uncharacterized protein E1B28_001321 [Marasmius oreades]KAG7099472.1 hypothetical protein E1B28_001321 [Marasmius oreades]